MILLIPLLMTVFAVPIMRYIIMPPVLYIAGFFLYPVGRLIGGWIVFGIVALCAFAAFIVVSGTISNCATYGYTVEQRAAYATAHPDDTSDPYDTTGYYKKDAPKPASTTFSNFDWKTKSKAERMLERIDENGRPF